MTVNRSTVRANSFLISESIGVKVRVKLVLWVFSFTEIVLAQIGFKK